MPKSLLLQVCASVGSLLGIILVYAGLKQDVGPLADVGLILFGASLLVTPVLRLLPQRAAKDAA